ncbi:MAG: polysaccharide pyruvyl transferase family protein [Alcanivorax sp.]|nr:polysaccharide pyruvyl transferase family protein [Alcanivorax sp.]
MRKPIKLHWASSKPNFGDMLSPLIVQRISGRPVELASIRQCELVAIGSLMQRLRKRRWRRLHVWGAGFISEQKPCVMRHHLHAVRGPETAALLKRDPASLVLGDPALLAGLLNEGLFKLPRRQRITVIPHYKDKDGDALARLKALNPGIQILDVFSDPMVLLDAIARSELVVSSAMHGLIAADALGIPNYRIVLSNDLRGGDFKFRDYYGVFGITPKEVAVTSFQGELLDQLIGEYHRPGLEKIQADLLHSFPSEL